MTRSFSFLVNPVSGGGAAPRVVVPLARRLREAGAEVELTYTTSAADVPPLVANAAANGAVVVAVGGDGMVSSIAGEAAAAGATLAIVPAGRGNDFARQIGAPTELDAQAALLLEGTTRPVDLLAVRLGDRPELLVAGSVYAGVDARAAEIVDRLRRLPGKLQYPFASVRALATYRPVDCEISVDGGAPRRFLAANFVLANSGYYGKGMHIAPDARVDDGRLDVVVIEAAGRMDLIRSLPKVYDGRHVTLDEVTVLRGTAVTVTGRYTDGSAVPVGGDGEALGTLAEGLSVTLRPGAVRLLG